MPPLPFLSLACSPSIWAFFSGKEHAVSFKEAAAWSGVWVSLALIFNTLFYYYAAWKFPQDERLMSVPGFDPANAAWNVCARIPDRLRRRKIAFGR